MGFAVYHAEKGTTNANQIGRHIDRDDKVKHTYEHADGVSRNIDHTPFKFQNMTLQEAIDKRIEEGYKGKKGIRSDAVKYTTHVLTGSHEEMKEIFNDFGKKDRWIDRNYKFLEQEFGSENIVKFVVHLDEKTPHIHAVTVPLTPDGRLSAKEMFGNKIEMSKRQDRYAEAMQAFDLGRGIKSTGIKHETAREYYARVKDIDQTKQAAESKVMDKIDAFELSKLDLLNAKEKINAFKDDLRQEIKKSMQEVANSTNSREIALKSQIRATTERVDKVKFAEMVSNVKNSISVLDYAHSLVAQNKLVFEGKKGANYFFGHPHQKTGSIAINDTKNYFRDYSENNKFGDVISLSMHVNKTTFGESLKELAHKSSHFQVLADTLRKTEINVSVSDENSENKAVVTHSFAKINHPSLINYAKERHLLEKMNDCPHVGQIHYENDKGRFFGIGFKNDSGGYDIRSEAFKGKIGKNDITTIKHPNGSDKVLIFEGFSDYVAYSSAEVKSDIIVLNSTVNAHKVLEKLGDYKSVVCALDNDKAGDNATELIKEATKGSFQDARSTYADFKDFADFHRHKEEEKNKEVKKEKNKGFSM